MRYCHFLIAAVWVFVSVVLVSCASKQAQYGGVAAAGDGPTVAAAEPAEVEAGGPRLSGSAQVVDAMVGQAGGQSVYASTILDPLADQLTSLGASLSREAFRARASELIARELGQQVVDALILTEAQRELTDENRERLNMVMKEVRAEYVRKYGKGSEELADQVLRETMGQGLDEHLRDEREGMIVRNFMRAKLLPKVNVNRLAIERYYRQHLDEFNPPAGRTIRLILANDPAKADEIERLFAEGQSFEAVAGDEQLNVHRPAQGGLFGENLSGEKIFDDAAVNAAVLALQPGEHTPRRVLGDRAAWVLVESISRPVGRTLKESQLEIEQRLRERQLQTLMMEYRQQLLEAGHFTPLPEMGEALVAVAISRYAAR